MSGLLIVFEGIDGSGKTTQIDLLKKYLAIRGIAWETVSFPQYGKNKYADYIFDYLSGKIENADIYDLAKVYASDRKTARDLITGWLKSGKLVIANRYVSSSKAHLGAHLPENKREEFIKWVEQLEYQENQMPREDLTILLEVIPKIGQKNSQAKDHPDLHEDDLKHLEKANQIFLKLAKEKNWVVVECMSNGKMKSPEDINKEIVKLLQSMVLSRL